MVWEELVLSLSSIWHPWHISGHKMTSSCMYSWASKWESLALVTTWSTLENSSTSRLLFFFVLVVGVGALGFVAHSKHRRVIVDNFERSISRCLGVSRRMHYFYHQIPDIKDGNTIHAQTSIQRNNFRFSWTVRHWSLLLTHTTYGNRRSTSEKTLDSSRGWLGVFKVSSKIWVSNSACFQTF